MIKSKKKEFLDEELKEYMRVPAKKKLEFLFHMNRFLTKMTPGKSKKIWVTLKKEGY